VDSAIGEYKLNANRSGSNPERPNQRKRGFNMGGFVTDETGKVVMHISVLDQGGLK